MRFDDSLDTVLATELTGAAAREAAWRQLVDLIGRRRAPARADAIARLRALRLEVPRAVRSASARGLERADPPAALVALFVDDDIAVAAPVARSARLSDADWIAFLPVMKPAVRGVLRLRRDLSGPVMAALAAFGPTDFTLSSASEGGSASEAEPEPITAQPEPLAPAVTADQSIPSTPPRFVPPEPDPFVTVADVARELPVVAEAMRGAEAGPTGAPPTAADFEIASLVARIEAHQRGDATPVRPAASPPAPPERFRFETDARGLIRWVEGVERGPLIGLSLAAGRDGAAISVDGVAGGALAHRGGFRDARLEVAGTSDAAGSWRISGEPAFDRASGRFTGYRGVARRPRPDEAPRSAPPATDALRQLVHELRTPANAISGFAEMIERELLGPVDSIYRERAAAIRGQTAGLLEAIDDLDTAARIESRRLDLYREPVALAPVLAAVTDSLAPLAEARGAVIALDVPADTRCVADPRALERLLSRFLAFVVAAAEPGERITGRAATEGDRVALDMDRPARLSVPDGALFDSDDEIEAAGAGGPLLGSGFGFRLARRLAGELGGTLTVGPSRLTLSLPAVVGQGMEQAAH